MIILKSLFITTVISALIAFSLKNIFGFWEAFCLSYAIQIILSFILTSKRISDNQKATDAHIEEIEELLDMSVVNIECPCGKNRFETAVFASIENIYDCEVCGSKFKADIDITPTLITEPLDTASPTDVSKTFDKLVTKKEL